MILELFTRIYAQLWSYSKNEEEWLIEMDFLDKIDKIDKIDKVDKGHTKEEEPQWLIEMDFLDDNEHGNI